MNDGFEPDTTLVAPTLEDYRKEFPRPFGISGSVNQVHGAIPVPEGRKFNHGWISPRGTFFECEYAGHDVWADTVCKYWDDIVLEEFPSYITSFKTYDEKNAECKKKWNYNYDLTFGDYLVSLGWMKWQYRQYYHEITRDVGRDILIAQWQRIEWLSIHSSTDSYKFNEVEI